MRAASSLVRALACALACASAACASAPVADGPATSRALAEAPVDLVIQGAVDAEVAPLVEALDHATRIQIASWTFWRGSLAGREVVVSRTEVGPINAVAATTLAITTFRPRLIINQGTAGATGPDLRVFDIVVGEATVDYGGFSTEHLEAGEGTRPETWRRMPHRLRLGGEERVAIPVFPCDPAAVAVALAQPNPHGRVIRGVIGSAFEFNREIDRLGWIRERYEAVTVDMESAFAGGTALGFNTPFLAVRIVSDSEFHAPGIRPGAAEHCARFVARLVEHLPAGDPKKGSV